MPQVYFFDVLLIFTLGITVTHANTIFSAFESEGISGLASAIGVELAIAACAFVAFDFEGSYDTKLRLDFTQWCAVLLAVVFIAVSYGMNTNYYLMHDKVKVSLWSINPDTAAWILGGLFPIGAALLGVIRAGLTNKYYRRFKNEMQPKTLYAVQLPQSDVTELEKEMALVKQAKLQAEELALRWKSYSEELTRNNREQIAQLVGEHNERLAELDVKTKSDIIKNVPQREMLMVREPVGSTAGAADSGGAGLALPGELLYPPVPQNKPNEKRELVRKLKSENPTLTNQQIADRADVSLRSVVNYLKD